MQPEPNPVAIEGNNRTLDADRLVLERHPPEASLSTPSELGLPRPPAAVNVFVADLLHRLRRDADQLPRASGGRLKFILVGPTLIVFEGVTLGTATVIPNDINRTSSRVELLARPLVLDAIAKGFERKLDFVGHVIVLSCYGFRSQT